MKLVANVCVHVTQGSDLKVIVPGESFMVEDAEAERLILLGAAKPVAPVIEDAEPSDSAEEGDDVPVEGMNREQLIAVAKQLGLTVAKNASTEKIRAAVIAEVSANAKEAEIDEESDNSDNSDDDI